MESKRELKIKVLKEGYSQGIIHNGVPIHTRLNLSAGTTEYILKKLKEDNAYSKTRLEINLPKIGLSNFAWMFFSINWGVFDEEKFMDRALAMTHVHTVCEVTGKYDFGVKILGPSIKKIYEFIHDFEKTFKDSIIDTEVFYALDEYKRHYSLVKEMTHYKTNKLDCILIEEKVANPEISLLEVAKKTGFHRNSVSNRWKKLWTDGVLVKECLVLTQEGYDEIKMGLKAMIIIKAMPGKEDAIIRHLLKYPEAQDIFTTITNEIFVIVRTENSGVLSTIHKRMAKLNLHIRKTNTIIFLNKHTKKTMARKELETVFGIKCGA